MCGFQGTWGVFRPAEHDIHDYFALRRNPRAQEIIFSHMIASSELLTVPGGFFDPLNTVLRINSQTIVLLDLYIWYNILDEDIVKYPVHYKWGYFKISSPPSIQSTYSIMLLNLHVWYRLKISQVPLKVHWMLWFARKLSPGHEDFVVEQNKREERVPRVKRPPRCRKIRTRCYNMRENHLLGMRISSYTEIVIENVFSG